MSSGLRSSVHKARNGDVCDGQQRRQRVQVLRHRALADQHGHALADLLQRFLGRRGLVVGADAGGEIAVEIESAHERRVAVDMTVGEGRDLGEAGRIAREDAGKVHELRKPDHLRMIAIAREIRRASILAPDVSR